MYCKFVLCTKQQIRSFCVKCCQLSRYSRGRIAYFYEAIFETGQFGLRYCRNINYIILDTVKLYIFTQYYNKDKADVTSIVQLIFCVYRFHLMMPRVELKHPV